MANIYIVNDSNNSFNNGTLRYSINNPIPLPDYTIYFEDSITNIDLILGSLNINADTKIINNTNHQIIISGLYLSGIFVIHTGVKVTIEGLTITNGNVFLGAGIYNNDVFVQ